MASDGAVEHGAGNVAVALASLFASTCKAGCVVDRGYIVKDVSDMCAALPAEVEKTPLCVVANCDIDAVPEDVCSVLAPYFVDLNMTYN